MKMLYVLWSHCLSGKIASPWDFGAGTEADPLLWNMPCSLTEGSGMDLTYSNGPRSPWGTLGYSAPREPPAFTAPLTVIFFPLTKIFNFFSISQNRKQRRLLFPSLSFSSNCHETRDCQAVQEGLRKTQFEERHWAWGTGRWENHGDHLKKRRIWDWHHTGLRID